uniref:hypothetical protein n=1 Tax=Mycobacterium sp. HUMS_1102779 TaxID=3383487 RepID=UPI00389AF2AC
MGMNSRAWQAVGLFAGGAVVAGALAVSGFGFSGDPGYLATATPTTTPSSSAPSAPSPDNDAPGDTGCIPGVNC